MTVLGRFCAVQNRKTTDLRDPRLWHEFGFFTGHTQSGYDVTPESALQVSAYYDAIRIISEDCAKLPFITFRRLDRGKERAPTHPVFPLLQDQSNRNMTAFTFRETITSHALGWGNGYARIRRDFGVPVELELIHPSRVEPAFTEAGELFYMVKMGDNKVVAIQQFDMLHMKGLTTDGITGLSVARVGAESIGRGIAQQQFGASFFRAGSSAMGAIKHPMVLDEEDKERLRTQWQETYSGPQGWHKPLILEEGMEWQQITIPPEDAQLLESENFTVLEVARWFRLPPHKLAHLTDATFSNVEAMALEYVVDTLMPWLCRWEKEVKRKLFMEDGDQFFAEHVLLALLRGDSAARSTLYRELWNIGVFSQNDIRELENMNPIEDGDVYYIPMNVTRTEDAASGEAEESFAPSSANRQDGNDNEPRDFSARAQTAATVLLYAVKKLQQRERKHIEYQIKKGHAGEALSERVRKFYVTQAILLKEDLQQLIAPLKQLAESAAPVDVFEIVNLYVRDVCSAKSGPDYFTAIDREGPLMVRVIVNRIFTKGETTCPADSITTSPLGSSITSGSAESSKRTALECSSPEQNGKRSLSHSTER